MITESDYSTSDNSHNLLVNLESKKDDLKIYSSLDYNSLEPTEKGGYDLNSVIQERMNSIHNYSLSLIETVTLK